MHFHLDHAGALPWFLLKTAFKGRCFMTHATKAIYRWLLADYIKVSNISTDHILYTEADLEASMDKIETINFHEEKEIKGVKFWAYHAGHVLGAAMFMIEIAGEDRHLMAAEVPSMRPDVMIVVSFFFGIWFETRNDELKNVLLVLGVDVWNAHPREAEDRETRFTSIVHDIVGRGGRCLIPVFALGRAQELLLILDEYWALHPELHDIPIYYASSLAKKCMSVYQTYVNFMNERIRRQIAVSNPFVFKHISNLKSIDHFDDVGPCVVMASPGMMQSGLSRELFEMWCTDPKNGVIIAGYVVEGTLAKQILSEPEEVTLLSGAKVPLKMSVDYISFSAHTDYEQTSEFIRTLRPPHIVLVHGEQNEMGRLKAALIREYEDEGKHIDVYNPKNTQAVELRFKGEKMAKVMGALAVEKPVNGKRISGILVKRNFNYHIVAPQDLSKYTDLNMSVVTQRQLICYTTFAKEVEVVESKGNDKRVIRVFGVIDVVYEKGLVTVAWVASPVNDMFADAALTAILQADSIEVHPNDFPPPPDTDRDHFKVCFIMRFMRDEIYERFHHA
ncbi:Cleavage and polyadenylation specificity factor subunit 3 [Orchesella cincta]|uniref:Cleavage and polyadenylation specificity factor subunit 3 n=1 Tax=Orchesella cincta TaxID=48709 RepID=A0A1D2M626_ORCCI|nr:Cleavage and polyadenylation specificity factor subunit 3 [Orchesella cincta]